MEIQFTKSIDTQTFNKHYCEICYLALLAHFY